MSTNRNEGSSILDRIRIHTEEGCRLNDELLAERDAVQARIEQFQAYRHELDAEISRRGIRPNDERPVHVPTTNPSVVKRSRQEKIDYVQSVPVVHKKATLAQIIRDVCADGGKRSASEIFALVNARRPNTSRPSFDSIFYTIGLQSQRDHESAHHSAKVYWLPSPNVVGERNDTAN
jgi:hypothetical protein